MCITPNLPYKPGFLTNFRILDNINFTNVLQISSISNYDPTEFNLRNGPNLLHVILDAVGLILDTDNTFVGAHEEDARALRGRSGPVARFITLRKQKA